MEPTRRSVLKAMTEFRAIGNEAFLKKYTKGRPPLYMYLRHEGILYPLKALWVASHGEIVTAASFNTWQARSRLGRLNFTDTVNLEDDPIIVLDEAHRLHQKRNSIDDEESDSILGYVTKPSMKASA